MLTKKQLKQLRENIILNSIYLDDYSNNLRIKKNTCCSFFDSYMEYLYELARDDNFNSNDISDVLNKYDKIEVLYNYYLSFENDPLSPDDYIAYYNDGIYAGVLLYDIQYSINDYAVIASYYIKNGATIINKITRNKIYYDDKNDAYIKKYNRKYLLNDFIKTNYNF